VVALSCRYALIDPVGRQVGGYWDPSFNIRPVRDEFKVVTQKLFIAAAGRDADVAVEKGKGVRSLFRPCWATGALVSQCFVT
jgi:hypothetical protein